MDQADIVITGTYSGSPSSGIEARWNFGSWTTIVASPSGGTFSGTLTGQSIGQGVLEVRYVGDPSTVARVQFVGVGDIFVCAGQSNMSGAGSNNQTYSHATLRASLFGNDYRWQELFDPYDSHTNQVDAVSLDNYSPRGTFIPLLATMLLTTNDFPVAFIPVAKSGTAITSWLPGSNHQDRTTLYGSMVYRALQVGGVKGVLWWQGESDVISGMSQATYNGHLDTIANAIAADLGVDLIPAKLHNITQDESAVNAAIGEAWSDNSNVTAGPDLNTVANNGLHVVSDAALLDTAQRWAGSILTAFPP